MIDIALHSGAQWALWIAAAVISGLEAINSQQDAIIQITTVLTCAIVIVRAEPAMNQMRRETLMTVRLAFYQLAVAAGAEISSILLGRVPTWREAMMSGGVAALMLCERRIRLLGRISDRRGEKG